MKPIKLTICGINSYTTPQTIDFKLLSQNNIFGIFGQTGSGKSTILDCIVLALYGSSDRENLTSLINVNLHDAFVDFEFEMEQDSPVCYRVVRTFKMRPSGFKSYAELVDLTHKINLGDTSEKVNFSLQSIIGIAKKEFLKCIALPQNEFDKFITDSPQERKRSLAKLFNLENFGENLNEKVKGKISVLSAKKASLTEQLNAFSFVTKDSQKQLSIRLDSLQRELGTNIKQSEKLKQQLSEISLKFDKSKQYLAAKLLLDDMISEEKDYIKLSSDLEFFKSNKENIVVFSEINSRLEQIKQNKQNIKTIEKLINEFSEKQNRLNAKIESINHKIESKKIAKKKWEIAIEKNKIILGESQNLKAELSELETQKEFWIDEYDANSMQAEQYNSLILACEKNCENLKMEIGKLTKISNKIEDVFSLSESEVFVKNLADIKTCFNQTNIDEIEHYRAYRDFTKALTKINRYIFDCNQKLTVREEIAKELDVPILKIKELNRQVNTKLTSCEKKLSEESARLSDLKETAIKIEYEAKNIFKNLNDVKNAIEKNNNKLTLFNQDLMSNLLVDNTEEIEKLEQLKTAEVEKLQEVLSQINEQKTTQGELVVANKFLMEEVEELNKKLPDNFNPKLASPNITDANILDNEEKLEKYLKNKNYYQTLVENLFKELGGKVVYDKSFDALSIKNEELTQTINNLRVEVGVVGSTLENNEKILEKNLMFEKELVEVDKQLELVLKLQSHISKNALVDFVSEEYLYLITEYSNKFVNRISRGKYLLSYNNETSEFMAIDNFNGGISRSIKTLSGGERFIFSLSLALGVSQSIAVSNNKNFNFFFIDEGFGNLSDDYIDNVLECFETLTRLDLTVGFITHVDRMQEFITNKVVVEKDNNQLGSIIKQY